MLRRTMTQIMARSDEKLAVEMSIEYSVNQMARAQSTINEVLTLVLRLKENGAYEDLKERCKERFKLETERYQSYLGENEEILGLIDTDFERLPGSYRLSLLLACFESGGFDFSPEVQREDQLARRTRKWRTHRWRVPPILRMKYGVNQQTLSEKFGEALREKAGGIGRESKSSNVSIGKALLLTWPEDFVQAVFNDVNRPMPVLLKYLKTDRFWQSRGLAVLEVKVDEKWYREGDQSRFHNVIIPLRLLNEDDAVEEMKKEDENNGSEGNKSSLTATKAESDGTDDVEKSGEYSVGGSSEGVKGFQEEKVEEKENKIDVIQEQEKVRNQDTTEAQEKVGIPAEPLPGPSKRVSGTRNMLQETLKGLEGYQWDTDWEETDEDEAVLKDALVQLEGVNWDEDFDTE